MYIVKLEQKEIDMIKILVSDYSVDNRLIIMGIEKGILSKENYPILDNNKRDIDVAENLISKLENIEDLNK
jgi:hypothetical protein